MKKLIHYICLAAVFLFMGTQNAAAQNSSQTDNSTFGRISTDVDLFFNVNDWAGLQFARWFSYIRMESITSNDDPAWEAGLALELPKIYLGLYYNGSFNMGSNDKGTITINNGILSGGVDISGDIQNRIVRDNFYGILVGFGAHGIKFTVDDNMETLDIDHATNSGVLPDSDGNNIPADSQGWYRYRNGDITPKLQWGAAQDMPFGKFSARPSVSLELGVGFDEKEYGLTDADGKYYHYEDFSKNTLKPRLGVDTGTVGIWSGDWGSVGFGASEEIGVIIKGEGDDKTVPWDNVLTPYAVFDYQPSEYFKLGAKLSVPIIGGFYGTTSKENFFGIGATNDDTYDCYPTLVTGFQLKCRYFNSLRGKTGVLDRLVINWGIGVKLPGYVTYGTYEYDDSDPDKVTIKETRKNEWRKSDLLQEIRIGLAFSITDNVVIDAGLNLGTNAAKWKEWGLAETVLLGSVMISVKHMGPKRVKAAAPASGEAPAATENVDFSSGGLYR